LHNASDRAVKGVVEGTAAGVKFEQPVELAAHEDRTVVFTPEQFAQLRIRDPKPWWPRQMGEPHLERLTMSFREQGEVRMSRAWSSAFARSLRSLRRTAAGCFA
jgi:exo-1,4-beta-D-glucosaminidase